jgi:hypothetical protein
MIGSADPPAQPVEIPSKPTAQGLGDAVYANVERTKLTAR